MTRQRTAFRLALMGAAVPAALVLGAGPALAASDVTVSNTETIQAHLDATGKVKDKRVYEQLALTGSGKVEVSNPVSTDGLRNLDGFKGFDVKDGNMIANVDVNGEKRLRSVSNFTKDIPLTVEVSYTLDGKPVKPGDVVGKSGDLGVNYKVTNTTGKSGSVTFDDGTGKQVTKDEQVVIPMVGSLSTQLPSNFTEVASKQANIAGDGNGGTKLSFTMTLFPPIGSETAEFGYTARISDGVIPPASISALPLNPLESPSFSGGAESYKSGAATGAQLTDGAIQIDSNLLKLRDGANTLVAGLIKLQAGAHKLNDGLANDAAPGAALLADGASQLNTGVGVLVKGTKTAKAGSAKLAVGANLLAKGSAGLADGSDQVAAGAGDLADGLGLIVDGIDSLPTDIQSDPDFQRLQGALTTMQNKIGNSSDVPQPVQADTTLLGAINGVRYGLRSPAGVAHCDQTPNDADKSDDCGAADAVQIVSGKLSGAAAPGGPIAGWVDNGISVYKAIGCPQNPATPIPPVVPPTMLPSPPVPATCVDLANIVYGLGLPKGVLSPTDPGGLQAQTNAAAETLDQVQQGIGQLSNQTSATILGGLALIKLGVSNPACSLTNPTNPANPCGLKQAAGLVSVGINDLVAAIADQLGDVVNQAYEGAGDVADGAGQVADGAAVVAGGNAKLANGADDLNAGLGKINSGAGQLGDGAGQLSAGANKLSSGLGDAASGSGQLADGLDTAADGSTAIPEGAEQLSTEGTKVLIVKGKDTAQTFGEKYALIDAGAKRAQAESMAYGAPQGADGETAYSLEIAGADGESSRNWGRGLGALAIFAIAGGAAAAIRQKLV
ncbi:hypothetical protein [Angustibacter luteus]|uniref:Choice-of-anchor G family protein n=1 Tax=Angustibacter luteus TaxID=658456 RepID=A0ABW1JAP4_9ACTN